uniref:Uncharacterized protein n=1 Tax=Panagrolaimus sp. PS1159 TaxID=55785 RepID=A0AC35FBK1_9BILA
MTPNPGCITSSRSLADIRAEQADNLDRIRSRLISINVRDLVPFLVARQVLRTNEMSAVYSIVSCFLFLRKKLS